MDVADGPRHRPMAFDKMESLIQEMQDPDTGVPVRSQKLFLTYIPSAFMGYDLVEWLMERFNLDESSNVEAINLANLLCQYGYFFPVNDSKNLILKDDSSLYRFQSPYYWPWQPPRVAASGACAPTLGPDNVEYAIYLVKRTLRNKQRHALEDYEMEALANLKKNLAAKWDFITMQAEEQVRLAKERKKGDKIVSDSQERAYWRVARPPPGLTSALEPCPVPVRTRHPKPKKRTVEQVTREIEQLKAALDRTRVKTSIALEALLAYSETFAPYDPWLTPPQPSNPWVSDDILYWQINSPLVDVPSEKRVQRWAISIEELVADPTGLKEFTSFLHKEYSHENIRFWQEVMDLRKSSTKQIPSKLDQIYKDFLKPGAPCEINIDGATAERVAEGLRSGSRYALDDAAAHVYNLLLKKDCYPRFVRSDHFQRLLNEGKNVLQKKAKFFNFGGQVKKKPGGAGGGGGTPSGTGLSRRRGSDRSLSGSAHELAVCAAQPPRAPDPPPHSHSQSNLHDIRDPEEEGCSDVVPWECGGRAERGGAHRRQDSAADSGSSSSDLGTERRRLPQQSTLDGGLRGAPPPLRRLSAVEPRHLAPLSSPPHSPRPGPSAAPPPAHPPHPTPTISVSSAPDDTTPDEVHDPPSVFTSADPTPTENAQRTICDRNEREHSASVEVSDVKTKVLAVRSESGLEPEPLPHRTLTRELSTTKEIGPASSKDISSEIANLPEIRREKETVSPCPSEETATASCSAESSDLPKTATVTVEAMKSSASESQPKPMPVPTAVTTEVSSASSKSESSEGVAKKQPGSTVVPVGPQLPRPPPIAPLAVGEDIADDETDKVPCAAPAVPPAQPPLSVPVVSTTAPAMSPAEVPHAVPPTACAKAGTAPAKPDTGDTSIAHEVELPKEESALVKRDKHSEHKKKNDICPWEDENSAEGEAPFVKTYATLGYL